MTYPLLLNISGSIPANIGDPLLNTWILAWDVHKLTTDLRGFWDANIFYPHRNTLAYSEHLFASALVALPIIWLSNNPILAYNFVFLFSFVLSGFGMYLLVYHFTQNRSASLIAGIIFAFNPYRYSHLGHLQLLTTQWFPFTFLYLHKLFQQTNYKNLALFNLFFVLQVLSCGYYALYLALFTAFFILYFMLIHNFLNKDLWLKLTFFTLISIIVCLPFFYPYLEVKRQMGFLRSLDENISFSPDILNYFITPSKIWKPMSLIFKDYWKGEAALFPGLLSIILSFLALVIPLNRWSVLFKNQDIYLKSNISLKKKIFIKLLNISTTSLITIGILIILTGGFSFTILGYKVRCHHLQNPMIFLILFQSIRLLIDVNGRKRLGYFFHCVWKNIPPIPRGYLLMTILAFFLSLGPFIYLAKARIFYGPYYLLYQFFPGFNSLRVPARMVIMMIFGLSVLSGFGSTKLLSSVSLRFSRSLIIILLALFALMEGFSGPINTPKVLTGKNIPQVYQWLAKQKEDFAIIELPRPFDWSNTLSMTYNALSMYYSTYHWKKLVNGYSGFFPKAYPYIFFYIANFPSDISLNLLEEIGVRYVILHSREYPQKEWKEVLKKIAQYTDRLRYVEDFSSDIVYEVINYQKNTKTKKLPGKNLRKIPQHDWHVYSKPSGNPFYAVDRDITTRWSTNRPQKAGDYFLLDLGTNYPKLTKLVMYLGNSWNDFPRNYKLEISRDGKTWNIIKNKGNGIIPLIKGLIESSKNLAVTVEFPPVDARYLKITQTGSDPVYYWSIHEVEVLALKE
jgi:hypothetical protein